MTWISLPFQSLTLPSRLAVGVGVALAAAGVGYLGFMGGAAAHKQLSSLYARKLACLHPVLGQAVKTSSSLALGLVPLSLAVAAYTGVDTGLVLAAGAFSLGAKAWLCRQN
ncbi:hypothetical protein JST97_29150 [bacterium]|nr:hypothetical protein [bacterium]